MKKLDCPPPANNADTSALYRACFNGDVEAAVEALNRGCPVDAAMNKEQHRPLHMAAGRGYQRLCLELLRRGAAVDARDNQGETPLFQAARYGHAAVCEILLDHGADIHARRDEDMGVLHVCFSGVGGPTMELLIKRGARVDALDSRHQLPLHGMAVVGQADLCELLIRQGSPTHVFDVCGRTPFHVAAIVPCHRESVFRALVRNGFAPDEPDVQGDGPIFHAADAAEAANVLALMALGADPNATDHQGRTLMERVVSGSRDVEARLLCSLQLLAEGVDGSVALARSDSLSPTLAKALRSPLLVCVDRGFLPLAMKLVEQGHDPALRRGRGKNAYETARDNGRSDMIDMMRAAYARHHATLAARAAAASPGPC